MTGTASDAVNVVLAPVTLLAHGVITGIMLVVAGGVMPLMMTMSYEPFVRTTRFLGPRFDPFMPVIVTLTTVADAVLAGVTAGPAVRALYGGAAVLLVAFAVITMVKNVPINKYVNSLDPRTVPADWAANDPRRVWWSWHLARTTTALLAMGANAAAAAVLIATGAG